MPIYAPKYCVYLTVYTGNKLPMFYIGSTLIDTVLNKHYHGSVKSKKYKLIFQKELTENPHLFKTIIISKYYSRKKAMYRERILQQKLNVVKSEMYMNMSIAKDFGWFGMSAKRENNPVYGKRWKKTPEQIENSRISSLRAFSKPSHKKKMSELRKNKLPLSKKQIEEKKKLYNEILRLYNSMPILQYGQILRNGHILTYDRAFAKTFCNQFNLTANGLYIIITKDTTAKRLLCQK